MTETTSKKVEKWSYPLKVGAANAKDPQQYYQALSKASDGYYPLGANGLWHGGIHFDEATGLVKENTEVFCIADGEVVAYRVDETYPKSDYGSTHAIFSTGFVLVKHRLELPSPQDSPQAPSTSADQSQQPIPQPTEPSPSPSFIFFSLYMHLLDWKTYENTPAIKGPDFWGGNVWQVKATAKDPVLGLRVRAASKKKPGHGTILAVLPRGTSVETGEEEDGWLKINSYTPTTAELPPSTGWVFKKEMGDGASENNYLIGGAAKDACIPPRKGLAVHAAADKNSATIAVLPIGTKVKIGNDGKSGEYQKLLEVIGDSSALFPSAAAGAVLGYVWQGLLEKKVEPARKDQVSVLDQPYQIKAGEKIGHAGKYQNHSDPTPKNLLHLEVFSCESLESFRDSTKGSLASLPDKYKSLVKIPAGTALVTHQQGITATNPPKPDDPHTVVGFDFVIPVSALEVLSTDKKIKAAVTMAGVTTTTLWWRVDNVFADKDGNQINGWFAEPDIKLSRHSPWEWNGFDFIKESTSNVDHLVASLHAQELLSEEERAKYTPEVSGTVSGPVNERLYKIVDKSQDKKISTEEIREALKKPWYSQPISQLVTNYESEWLYEDKKWNALDEVMGHTDSDPHKAWQEEKQRIKALGWWSSLSGKFGISEDPKVWHIHPVALLSNFQVAKAGQLITLKMLKTAKPNIEDSYCEEILPYLNKYAALYKVDNPLRVAHFLAQVGHENGFKVTSEDLDYSAIGMRRQFGCRKNKDGYDASTDECLVQPRLRPKLWSEPSTYANNAQKLGSYVYANRNDNGDEASGEGYKYRGRGVIQLTGKYNYRKYTRIHNQADPSDPQDFVANPDLIITSIKYGVESAFVWWSMSNINQVIDDSLAARTMSDIDGHVSDVSIKVNGGTTGLQDRINLFIRLKDMVEEEMGA